MTLVALDFDGTLTDSDLTVLLGREYDVAGEMRGLAEQGLRGDVEFAETLRQRASLLEGMPETRVETAFERCKLRDGAADLVGDLRRSGVQVAVITGGFERGVRAALDGAGVSVDHVVANTLVIENGAVTGEVTGPLMEGEKDQVFEEIVAAAGVDRDRTVAVGNGVTDLPMLHVAETTVGFDPVPVVEPYCDVVVTSVHRLRLYFEQHGVVDTA